jgi:hypothetical protein
MNRCEYCDSVQVNTATGSCNKCGAPLGPGKYDHSVCPFCKRKLLAMASISCNYCGKGLPPDLVQIRQSLARTLVDQTNHSQHGDSGFLLNDDSAGPPSLLESLGDIIRVTIGNHD